MFSKPSDYDAFKADIPSDLDSDDLGVYEVFWHANGWYPALPVSSRLAVAEQVVRDLLEDGRVRLVQALWASGEERQPVPDVEETLLSWATWVPEDPVVWMALQR